MASSAFRSPPVLTAVRAHRLNPLLVAAPLLFLASCATARPPEASAPPRSEPVLVDADLLLGEPIRPVDRGLLGGLQYDLPIEANSWVEQELTYLITERKELIDRWIDEGDFYKGFIQQVLSEHDLPTDLYHLAMIESGFTPTAKSHAGAAGMWQFMPGTAGDVGLRVDRTVDERLDPIRSTRAAARHLRSLHRIHEDWALAAAAYNAGSGRINRGLAKFGARDFWELARVGDLAEETRQFVPRLYAVTILARDRERFGLRPPARVQGLAFDSIWVDYETPLAALAGLGQATQAELERLNPHLIRTTTPSGGYWVWVPKGTGQPFQRAYLASNIRAEQGLGRYTIRWGDTLGRLAQISGIASSRIRELNPSVDFDRLIAGEEIQLPPAAAKQLASRPVEADEPRPEPAAEPLGQLVSVATVADAPAPERRSVAQDAAVEVHRVESGESLWGIARQYGVSIEQLQAANEIDGSVIVPGQRLTIPRNDEGGAPEKESTAAHTVEPGDTLWEIARRYGTSIEAIQGANDLGERPIRPGQVLVVPS